jgi:hypothetical protein
MIHTNALILENLSCPFEAMRFHLVYQGRLPGTGNSGKPSIVRDIRDAFHPQMEFLWKTHRSLQALRQSAIVSKEDFAGLAVASTPFSVDRDLESYPARDDEVDLCAPIERGGKKYIPLVRSSLHLNCEIHITFLRQEDPGSLVLQGGDLDNRVKALLDALRMPEMPVATDFPQANETTYCLLESDTLVSDFSVNTGRLLVPSSTHPHEVHLLLEVMVRVLRVGEWNMPLLGN